MKTANFISVCSLSIFIFATAAVASDIILVEAKATTKDANGKEQVTKMPRVITLSAEQAQISVTWPQEFPAAFKVDGKAMPFGSILDVTPQVEENEIHFRAHLMMHDFNGYQSQDDSSGMSFSTQTQELFETGTIQSGGTKTFCVTNQFGGVTTWNLKMTKVGDDAMQPLTKN